MLRFLCYIIYLQHTLPCILTDHPVMTLRGLCNQGGGLDRKFSLSMDEETGDIVYFGNKFSRIRFVMKTTLYYIAVPFYSPIIFAGMITHKGCGISPLQRVIHF